MPHGDVPDPTTGSASVEEPPSFTTRFVDFPLQVMDRARQHAEAMLREFAFIVQGGGDDTRVPARLLEIAAQSDARYAGLNPDADDLVEAALASGIEFVTFDVQAPIGIVGDSFEAVPVLLEVEQYCLQGDMLTLAPTPEIRAFWQWYLGEYARQLAGDPPRSWRDHFTQ